MSSSLRKNLPESELPVVSGYVHEVSDVLLGKQGGRYFDFKALTLSSEVFTRISCFSPDKRNALKNKNESKSAVQLLNISPSKRSYDPDKKEYTMNKYSKVTDGRPCLFHGNCLHKQTILETVLMWSDEMIDMFVKSGIHTTFQVLNINKYKYKAVPNAVYAMTITV